MANKDWYLIGFIITIIFACLFWALAIVVYRSNKKDYLNKMLALSMVFLGLWILSGFVEKILSAPSDTLTLWTFRWAYASGIMATIFFFLFTLGLYLGRAPKKKIYYPILTIGTLTAILSFSPLIVRLASYQDGILKSQEGLFFFLVPFIFATSCLCGIYLIYKKWRNSTGIDHARTSVVLFSMIIFLPIVAISSFILPALTDNDISSNYAYLACVIPVGLASYAIVRLRLLDVRIILRKTSVFIIGTIILSLPILSLFFLFKITHLSPGVEQGLTVLLFMVLIVLAPVIWRYIHNLSSRLFFSELYDERLLLDVVSSKLVSQGDPESGLMSAISEIVHPLGLNELSVVIPPGGINDNCWKFECSQETDGSIRELKNDNYHFKDWFNFVDGAVVTEELLRWPRDSQEKKLGNELAASGLAACVPIKVLSQKVGYFLVGEKVALKAITSTDISLLGKSGDRFGLFIDNYSLSAQLGAQLEELEQVYGNLHEAYDFKSEIIQVTSHEFRTPTTIVKGYVQTLLNEWSNIDEEEKLSFLEKISSSCNRLKDLADQFFTVSSFQEGDLNIEKVPISLNTILNRLCSSITPLEQERLIIEANPDMYIISDPEHLHILLKSLLDNALRFSPADKPVLLRAWRNSINDYIQIKDFGKGIPLEERETVFEPFVRLESVRHHSKGMGLGLHIVRLLSSRLGAEIEMNCSDGGGTIVTLVIPISI